jgi:hypothetical protein
LFLNPDPLVLNVAWGTLVNFFAAAMISAALILPMVIELRATGATSPATRIIGLRSHGKHVALPTIPLAIANGLFVFTFLGIVLAIFICVRFCLLAAAAVVENQDVTDSLARSWELTQGLFLRTSIVLLGAIAPFVLGTFALAWLNLSNRLTFLGITIAAGLVIPFVLIVIFLLFEDYRTLESEPDDFGTSTSPPKISL